MGVEWDVESVPRGPERPGVKGSSIRPGIPKRWNSMNTSLDLRSIQENRTHASPIYFLTFHEPTFTSFFPTL